MMNEIAAFPQISHRVYKNTFLQNTLVEVSYDEISEEKLTVDFKEKKKLFFNRYFGLDQSNSDFVNDGISISTSDKSQNLIFTKCKSLTNVNRSVYKTFVESVLPHVFEISTFLRDVVQLRTVKSIIVRKINVFPVVVDKSMNLSIYTESQKVLENVLSQNFLRLNHETDTAQIANAVSDFEVTRIQNSNRYTYTIKTGILQSKDPATKYVVLDLSAESQMIINTQDIEDRSVSLNNLLFDLYHWTVTDEIVDKMLQE